MVYFFLSFNLYNLRDGGASENTHASLRFDLRRSLVNSWAFLAVGIGQGKNSSKSSLSTL